MYAQFVREMPESVDKDRAWEWMRKALIFAAQEQALRTNAVKFNIERAKNSPLCRLCGELSAFHSVLNWNFTAKLHFITSKVW